MSEIKCPYCGKSIPSDAQYCPYCGKRLQVRAINTKVELLKQHIEELRHKEKKADMEATLATIMLFIVFIVMVSLGKGTLNKEVIWMLQVLIIILFIGLIVKLIEARYYRYKREQLLKEVEENIRSH